MNSGLHNENFHRTFLTYNALTTCLLEHSTLFACCPFLQIRIEEEHSHSHRFEHESDEDEDETVCHKEAQFTSGVLERSAGDVVGPDPLMEMLALGVLNPW